MGFTPFANLNMSLQATTGPGGFALQNATPTILSWTAPNDGQIHRFFVYHFLDITSGETGGQINALWTGPGTHNPDIQVHVGGQGAGFDTGAEISGIVAAGGTVTLQQVSALTVGAANFWAEIWGS